jgi:drug/metabolite transporter (DMT)-like permease
VRTIDTASTARFNVSPYLLLTLTNLFWAGNWIVGRAIRHDVPPVALGFWRWVIALAPIVPLALPHLRAQWPLIRRHWRILSVLAVLGTGFYNSLAYIGLNFTTATNGVLLNSFVPVMIPAIAWLGFGKRLQPIEALGIAVSLAGVLTIIAQGKLAVLLAFQLNAGDLWVLASVVSWALYTLFLQRRPMQLHPMLFLATLAVIGLVVTLPLYLWEISTGRLINPAPLSFAAIGYAGVFPAFLGYLFWTRGVSEIGPNKAGLFMHLMPAFGILLSVSLLGERPELYHLFGIILIFTGIALATGKRPKLS